MVDPVSGQRKLSGRYVWACSVCRDPDYTREGPGTLYLDERWCPTCQKRQPIISFHIEDVPMALPSGEKQPQ